MKYELYKDKKPYKHWSKCKLEAHILRDVLPTTFFNQLKKFIDNILDKNTTNTFLTHNTILHFNNIEKRIVSHRQNKRYQNVIYDLTFDPNWYNQTNKTVAKWAKNKLNESISPLFVKYINTMYEYPPFNGDKSYIPIRLHINVIRYEEFLGLHTDFNPIHFNTKDVSQARVYSSTFYLHDSVENAGGELWTPGGFVYKPCENSCVIFNGNQVMHGVTENLDPEKRTRLAFTVRYAHVDDLFLPGSPDLHLYKQDHL